MLQRRGPRACRPEAEWRRGFRDNLARGPRNEGQWRHRRQGRPAVPFEDVLRVSTAWSDAEQQLQTLARGPSPCAISWTKLASRFHIPPRQPRDRACTAARAERKKDEAAAETLRRVQHTKEEEARRKLARVWTMSERGLQAVVDSQLLAGWLRGTARWQEARGRPLLTAVLRDLAWLYTGGGRRLRNPAAESVERRPRGRNQAADRLAGWALRGEARSYVFEECRNLATCNLRLLSDAGLQSRTRTASWGWLLVGHIPGQGCHVLARAT